MGFRLVPKSVTLKGLNDLERHNGSYRAKPKVGLFSFSDITSIARLYSQGITRSEVLKVKRPTVNSENMTNAISRKRCKIGLMFTIGMVTVRIWAFDWYQNRWPWKAWMTLNGTMAVRYFAEFGSFSGLIICPMRQQHWTDYKISTCVCQWVSEWVRSQSSTDVQLFTKLNPPRYRFPWDVVTYFLVDIQHIIQHTSVLHVPPKPLLLGESPA